MTHRRLTAALAATLGLCAPAALAQSYNAPTGMPAVMTPGGLEGRAAAHNLHAFRASRGHVVGHRRHPGVIGTGSIRAPLARPQAAASRGAGPFSGTGW